MNDYWHLLRGLLILGVIALSFYATHLLSSELVLLWRPQFEVQGDLLIGAFWIALALYYVNFTASSFSD